ncbi:MAG: membrane protein [marine bacterium B5-7]|nr:MAG: membrane protein [marine bacterium B5-7]
MFDINFSDLLSALALVFILEGLMPFLNPEGIRKVFLAAAQMDNQTLRFLGVSSMLVGLILLYIVR